MLSKRSLYSTATTFVLTEGEIQLTKTTDNHTRPSFTYCQVQLSTD